MSEPRPFGNPEGIGKRLAYWANQLSRNKSYPWVGMGIIDDLKCAAKLHGADFDTLFPLEVGGVPTDSQGPRQSIDHKGHDPVVEEEDEFASFVPAVQDFDL